jgi:hypothetical protein
MLASGWWKNTMEPYFGDVHDYHNFTKGKKGCAQFIVSRERIHSLPKQFYQNMYDWIVINTLHSETEYVGRNSQNSRKATPIDNHILSNWHVSRYLEWTWELIFTVHKPWEKNSFQYNDKTITCLYGGGKYLINVNPTVQLHFLKDDSITIPKEIDFKTIFPLVTSNIDLMLFIKVNGAVHVFYSNYPKNQILTFSDAIKSVRKDK